MCCCTVCEPACSEHRMECFRDGIDTNTHKTSLAFQDMEFFSSCCENLSGFQELTGTGHIHI